MTIWTFGAVVHAQDAAPTGVQTYLDVSQRLEFSDNPSLSASGSSEFFSRTALDFGLTSETRTENFSISAGGDLELGRSGQDTVNLANRRFRLDYGREGANANFNLSLRQREIDVSSSFLVEDFLNDSSILVLDDGSRRNSGATINGAFGLNDPIGGSYRLDYSEINYIGTTNPSLRDQTNLNLSGQLTFQIDPRIQARLTAKYIDFDAGTGGVSRETFGFGAGVRLEVNPRLVADFALSYDEITRSGASTGTDDGLTLTGDLNQEMPNGSLGLNFSSSVSSNTDGRRNTLQITRDMAISPISNLSFGVGLTQSAATGVDPFANLTYRQERGDSRLTVGLTQSVRSDGDNQENLNTSLRASFDRDINSNSSYGVGLSLFDRHALDSGGGDAQRVSLDLTYRHDLNRDWQLVSGVTHRRASSNAASTRRSNTVFLEIERRFDWNP